VPAADFSGSGACHITMPLSELTAKDSQTTSGLFGLRKLILMVFYVPM